MIGRLRGFLILKNGSEIMVDVGGVGYRMLVSAATLRLLPGIDAEVTLWVTTRFRDEAIVLYGFLEQREQAMFLRLLQVSGVGPKLAFAIIAAGDIGRLQRQIVNQEVDELAKLPGVGKKLSRRLVVELGDQLKTEVGFFSDNVLGVDNANETGKTQTLAELKAALQVLGYRSSEVEEPAFRVVRENYGESLERLLKLVLQELHRG
ncbi:MAG TPA: Holliday junction branch migration protein RuvA [Proteobacteria bacterium]|nr:Holliday junction branch migration protein RuvA [Pseudomonadota bacterium]